MSKKQQLSEAQDQQKSDSACVEIHVLACGHGDMILLRLAHSRWGLIDCHLEGEAAKAKFFARLEALGVRRLEFIILTHPDSDHYTGMADVVERFTRDGREIGRFYDTTLNWRAVGLLVDASGPEDEAGEYARLVRLVLNSRIEQCSLHEDHLPISIRGTPLKLVPIAPPEKTVIQPAQRVLLGESPGVGVNDLSIVLVLTVADPKGCLQVLLSADAESAALNRALKIWQGHQDNPKRAAIFDVVKVPHHGSRNGHCKELCDCSPKDGKGTAVISVGNKYRLPRANVLRDYLDENWTVLSTTTRRCSYRPNRLIEVFGRALPTEVQSEQHDVILTWTPGESPLWTPREAEILSFEVGNYFS